MLMRNVGVIINVFYEIKMLSKPLMRRFRREGIVWRSTGDRKLKPEPETVVGYGIASAFTPLENRKKGYAKHMMRLLHWVLAADELLPAFPAEWGAPPLRVPHAGGGRFSALWSDIGGDVYRRCGVVPGGEGWVVVSPLSTTWDVQSGPGSAEGGGGDWTWLDEEGVLGLWERDAEDIMRSAGVEGTAPVSLAFLPNKGVAAFQHRRFELFLRQQDPPVEHYGVISGGSVNVPFDENVAFATWTMEVWQGTPRTLLVTRLRSTPGNFGSLLKMLMQVARKHGLERVEVYNLGEELQDSAASLGGKTAEREEHLSSLFWYGPERTGDVAWLLNERSVLLVYGFQTGVDSLLDFAGVESSGGAIVTMPIAENKGALCDFEGG